MAGFKKGPNCKPIINITISEELLNKVEEFRFQKRLQNRSQAFCELVEYGFEFLSVENETPIEYVSFMDAREALFDDKKVWSHYPDGKRGYQFENGELWMYSGDKCGKVNHMLINDINNDFGWTIED